MNEETMFQEALSRPLEERAAFLEQACEGRPELLLEVKVLLDAHEKSQNLLDRPPGDLEATVDTSPSEPDDQATGAFAANPSPTADYLPQVAPQTVIAGRYTLVEKIGEGGMGEVWVAKQSEPVKRKVALKLIKAGMDSKAVLQRFEQERQALALMEHPNIARVIDGGMTLERTPFFVMELVNGLPLTKFCDEARLGIRERLELFASICNAVQHAHQKGIIHRDLKPTNILVTIIDGKPVPKVIDFGVAKATSGKITDESMSTQFGAIVGTLEYMSPEQAGFSGEDIDTRADIYSLGVILYELLTGLRPIDAKRLKKAALTEMIRIIKEEDPSKPSTRLSTDDSAPSMAALRHTEPKKLSALLRGELDWVVMKCLEKRRERRYETANGLARDIQRYLANEVVEARPPSNSYRLRKFASKHRAALLTAAAFALLLVAATAVSAGLAVWANREREKAEKAEVRAVKNEEQAIDAVKKFGDAISNEPELKKTEALEGLRKRLMNEPLAFFSSLRDRLQADGDTRPESLARLADASFNLGNLTSEIGDLQNAVIAYGESLAIRRKLADANPTVTKLQSAMATSYFKIGQRLNDIGEPSDSLKAHESGLAIRQRLVDANPTVAEFQGELASSHLNISYLLREAGKPAESLKACQSAMAILRPLTDAKPAVTEFRRDLAIAHNNIGIALRDTGKPLEALQSFESALAIQQTLVDTNPANTRFQTDLARTHGNIGRLMFTIGKPLESMKAHESAVAILQKLTDANPTVTEFLKELARSHQSIGHLQRQAGKPTEALKACELALAIQRKLTEANPRATELQRDLATSHDFIGVLLKDTGKPTEALKTFESALVIWEKLAREHPEMPDFAYHLGGTLNNWATIDFDAKRFDDARVRFRKAVEWERKALAVNPANPQYRQFLANNLMNLIVAARNQGDAEGAAETARELAVFRDSDPAMVVLDARLAAILRGDQQPKDNTERLRLAQRAYDKLLHAAAAKLWGDALRSDPKLAEDRQAQTRYNAACSAALAGCGQGKDEPSPDFSSKEKLRSQAREWLGAELAVWANILESGPPEARQVVAKTLEHWQQDSDLTGIRDEKELAKLSDSERKDWQAFWLRVADLKTRAETAKP